MEHMKIAILGGTGYLGKKLIEKLLLEDDAILCLKRKSSKANFICKPESIVELIDIENTSEEELVNVLKNMDCVINCSCKYLNGGFSNFEITESNLIIPLKILDFAIKASVSKFITIGTGLPDKLNIYSFAKSKFSDFGKYYVELLNGTLSFINIKLENFYGKDEPSDRFLPSIIRKLRANETIIVTEGFQKRDFVYIDDIINAIYNLIHITFDKGYLDLPIGSGEAPSIREIITYLHKITNSSSNIVWGGIPLRKDEPNCIADLTKVNLLGIDIKTNWQEGLHLLVEGRKQ